MPETKARLIYTLGYSGWDYAKLAARIEEMDAVLVDVRLSPRSRRPEWRQSVLQSRLRQRYTHMKEFGNVNYKGGPTRLLAFEQGRQRLEALLAKHPGPIILMCVCADYERCHRKEIVRQLKETGHYRFEELRPPEDQPKLL
jgi:uncharacterized protein (DUF488 family)